MRVFRAFCVPYLKVGRMMTDPMKIQEKESLID